MKNISILGSTGSIGVNALKFMAANSGSFKVTGLAAGVNIKLLAQQIAAFRPAAVAVLEENSAGDLAKLVSGPDKPEIFHGPEGFRHLATLEQIDTVISAMAGAAGSAPTYAAVKAGKNIALANKETMVMAGPLVVDEARKQGVAVLPIDSEHSAILQCLQGHPREDLRRIILTASGGPFREFSLPEMEKATPSQALNHPNWNMGRKISIDSATMMNKGLEVIEAKWLFDLRTDQIRILIHPESIVHSMVEYEDGSTIAQMGIPDMLVPISYALSFPRHVKNVLPPLELEKVGSLTFQEPDPTKFKCLDLALQAAKTGDSMPAVLNGANEIAVAAFLEKQIGFLEIPRLIEKTMQAHATFPLGSMEAVWEADQWARLKTGELLRKIG